MSTTTTTTTTTDLDDKGADTAAVAAKLQSDGAKQFVAAWNDLLSHIDAQSAVLRG